MSVKTAHTSRTLFADDNPHRGSRVNVGKVSEFFIASNFFLSLHYSASTRVNSTQVAEESTGGKWPVYQSLESFRHSFQITYSGLWTWAGATASIVELYVVTAQRLVWLA